MARASRVRPADLNSVACKPVKVRSPLPPSESQEEPGWSATVRRVRGEFDEMRGLALTPAQAARLFGLDEGTCVRVLHHLTAAGLLSLRPDGRYSLRAPDA